MSINTKMGLVFGLLLTELLVFGLGFYRGLATHSAQMKNTAAAVKKLDLIKELQLDLSHLKEPVVDCVTNLATAQRKKFNRLSARLTRRFNQLDELALQISEERKLIAQLKAKYRELKLVAHQIFSTGARKKKEKMIEKIRALEGDFRREAEAYHLLAHREVNRNRRMAEKMLNWIQILLFVAFSFNVFFVTMILLYFRKTVVQPLTGLRDRAVKVGEGDWNQQAEISSNDELGELAASFNRMVTDLKQTWEELEQARKYMYNIRQSMQESLIVVTRDGKIETVNRALEELVGYSEEELRGKSLDFLLEKPVVANRSLWELLDSEGTRTRELTYRTKEEDNIPVLFSAAPMYTPEKNLTRIVCVGTDITEWKQAESERKRLAAGWETASSGLIVTDLDGQIEFTNTAARQLLGYDEAELVGMHVSQLHSGSGNSAKNIMETLKEEGNWTGEVEHRRQDGTIFPVLLSNSLIRDENGTPEGMLGILQDISERKQMEQELRASNQQLDAYNQQLKATEQQLRAEIEERKQIEAELRESEHRFRLMAENIDQCFYLVKSDYSEVLYVNSAVEALHGVTREEVYENPEDWKKYIPDEDLAEMEKDLSEQLSGGMEENQVHEYRVEHPERGTRYIRAVIYPVYEDDKLTRLVGVNSDITERKQREAEYEALINGMNEIVLVIDFQGQFVGANKTAIEKLGYSRKQLLSIGPKAIDVGRDPERIESLIKSAKEEGGVRVFETIYETKNGQQIPVEISGTVVPHQGQPRIISVARDITERKEMEQELRKSYEELTQSLREKETLLQEVHHRVKNNMQVLSGLLYLQAKAAQNEKAREQLMESRQRVQSMALIHEKLYKTEDFSELDFEEYLQELITSLRQVHGLTAADVNFELDVDPVDIGLGKAVYCGLILNELTANTLEHGFDSSEEKLKLRINFVQRPDKYQLIFEDNGPGFPEAVESVREASLGLRLVYTLAEVQLDGTVEVVTSGEGTKFEIAFPRGKD